MLGASYLHVNSPLGWEKQSWSDRHFNVVLSNSVKKSRSTTRRGAKSTRSSHKNGSLIKQPRQRCRQERHKFAYSKLKNSSFARFSRACHLYISLSYHQRELSCFAAVGTRWGLEDKFQFFFSSRSVLQTGHTNVKPGSQVHVLQVKWIGIIAKWLQKYKFTFSEDVLRPCEA